MTRTSLLFNMYVEEYAVHRVLRQLGRYQEWHVLWSTLFLAPTIGELSLIFKFNSAFEDYSR
jgi:hypothetical protein